MELPRARAAQEARIVRANDQLASRRPSSAEHNYRHTLAPSQGIGGIFERFLELPVAIVIALLWLSGTLLLGASALGLYAAAHLVLQAV